MMLTFDTIKITRLGIHRSATHSPIFQTFFDYCQGMRERQPLSDCELELLEFDASRVPYDVALDIADDPDHGDYRLMLITRADMYSKQGAELLLTSYQKLVHAFMSTLDTSFVEPDVCEPHDIKRALQFGRSRYLYNSFVLSHEPSADDWELPRRGRALLVEM